MILSKDGEVRSACSFIQNKRFIIAMLIRKEMSETVHACQRLEMVTPEHRLFQRHRLPVRRFRLLGSKKRLLYCKRKPAVVGCDES